MAEGAFGAGPGSQLAWDNRWDLGLHVKWNLTEAVTARDRRRLADAQIQQTRLGYQELRAKLDLYKANARKFQHADGSFSTGYVSKAEDNKELPARIASTGHVLEWLALELSDDELRQSWMQDAASALAVMILENQNNPIDGGALSTTKRSDSRSEVSPSPVGLDGASLATIFR